MADTVFTHDLMRAGCTSRAYKLWSEQPEYLAENESASATVLNATSEPQTSMSRSLPGGFLDITESKVPLSLDF